MKKWINNITGSLTLIGIIIVLMGTQNKQSSNENWMIAVGAAEGNQELILKMNTENGDVCPANWQEGKQAMNPSDDGMRKYMASEADNL